MKLLIIVNDFYPETTSAGQMFFELCRRLGEKNIEIYVLTSMPKTANFMKYLSMSHVSRLFLEYSLSDNIRILRFLPTIYIYEYFRKTLSKLTSSKKRKLSNEKSKLLFISPRIVEWYLTAQYILHSLMIIVMGLIVRYIRNFNPNVILVYSPPIFYCLSAKFLSDIFGSPYVINLHDIHPKALIDLRILRNKLLIKLYNIVSSLSYKHACIVTVHSISNKNYLLNMHRDILHGKTIVLHNWIDLNRIQQAKDDIKLLDYNYISKIENKFVVIYGGVLGYSQNLFPVLKAAIKLKDEEEIMFLIIGEGPLKPYIEKLKIKFRLKNVIVLPYLPMNLYFRILENSDVGVVALSKQVDTPVVPKKFIDYVSFGKPVIAIVPEKSDVYRIISLFKCGLADPTYSSTRIADFIINLKKSKKLYNYYSMNSIKVSKLFDVMNATEIIIKILRRCAISKQT